MRVQSRHRCYLNRLKVDRAAVRSEALVEVQDLQHVQASKLGEAPVRHHCLRYLTATQHVVVVQVQQRAEVILRRAEVLGQLLCAAYRSSLGLRRHLRRRCGFFLPGAGVVSVRSAW